ncbi:MAG: hypothetical protein KDK04_05485 [Candidatus Competibacteraceae bacterium]|nr:hypothetical protein [Candidatus Competibacteraceae bacterium]
MSAVNTRDYLKHIASEQMHTTNSAVLPENRPSAHMTANHPSIISSSQQEGDVRVIQRPLNHRVPCFSNIP